MVFHKASFVQKKKKKKKICLGIMSVMLCLAIVGAYLGTFNALVVCVHTSHASTHTHRAYTQLLSLLNTAPTHTTHTQTHTCVRARTHFIASPQVNPRSGTRTRRGVCTGCGGGGAARVVALPLLDVSHFSPFPSTFSLCLPSLSSPSHSHTSTP